MRERGGSGGGFAGLAVEGLEGGEAGEVEPADEVEGHVEAAQARAGVEALEAVDLVEGEHELLQPRHQPQLLHPLQPAPVQHQHLPTHTPSIARTAPVSGLGAGREWGRER